MDGCALSAPSCTTRGARRPRAPPSACYHRHRKLMRRVDAPTITTTASRRRRDHDDAIFPKLKFLRDAESAREQEPDRHEELVVPLDLGAPAEFVLRQHGLDGRGLGLAARMSAGLRRARHLLAFRALSRARPRARSPRHPGSRLRPAQGTFLRGRVVWRTSRMRRRPMTVRRFARRLFAARIRSRCRADKHAPYVQQQTGFEFQRRKAGIVGRAGPRQNGHRSTRSTHAPADGVAAVDEGHGF